MRNYVRYGEKEEIPYPRNGKLRVLVCVGMLAVLFGLKCVPNEKVQGMLNKVRTVSTAQVVPDEEDIGKLSLVSQMLPEAVQSVWQENTGEIKLSPPFADGILLNDGNTGAVFEGKGEVLAGNSGKVEAVTKVENGFALVIDYGNGVKVAYAPLTGVKVAPEEIVEAGQAIGIALDVGKAKQIHVLVTRNGEEVGAKEWLK